MALDTATGAKVQAVTVAGPASYLTGGFLLDLSADFSWLGFLDAQVSVPGVLGPVEFELLLNRDLSGAEAFGKAAVKLVRGRYDRATTGAVTSNPASTTVQAAKTATATTTGSSHTHTFNHDHPAAVSATETASGALGVNLDAAGPSMRNHTHTFDVPAFTGSTPAGTHAHDRSFEYDHSHGRTESTVAASAVEVANGTNLSGTTIVLLAFGFGGS